MRADYRAAGSTSTCEITGEIERPDRRLGMISHATLWRILC